MLKGQLTHPQILEALGRAGHGSKILIADGNYPFATTLGRNATLVSLNLAPGKVGCLDVLGALLSAVPVEAAAVMQYDTEGPYARDTDPPIWADYRGALRDAGSDLELDPIARFDFYDVAGRDDVALTIATGEQRTWANILLTIGVVMSSTND